MKFLTKARTLSILKGKILSAEVPELIFCSVKEWRDNKQFYISKVNKIFQNTKVIVRSSCLNEDQKDNSNAGAYLSLPNVDFKNLEKAVDQVINSFSDNNLYNEILIQPMIRKVVASGVVFSHDPNTNSPYRVINISEGHNTEVVTGGKGGKLIYISPGRPKSLVLDDRTSLILKLVEELILLFDSDPIDCEFAISSENNNEKIWLLQARPLILKSIPETENSHSNRLYQISQKISESQQTNPFVLGDKAIFGIMPDWNPAEIIGVRPKPLSLSLYKELITDSIWAYQRHNYGYRNLRGFPLLTHFYGLPYIDVRLSFNSFIPAELNKDTATKLINYYSEKLLKNPSFHDKIEFEVVYSCYSPDLPNRLVELEKAGFTQNEIEAIVSSLKNITNNLINLEIGPWALDVAKIATLVERRNTQYKLKTNSLSKIYWLLEDAKRYGTLPFAGLARAGFVAIQMLKSLINLNIISKDDYDSFMSNISTVSKELARDQNILDKNQFLARYGHLRPGTYDIESSRYDECPDLYFDWDHTSKTDMQATTFNLSGSQMRTISNLMVEHNLKISAKNLFRFIKSAIEMREKSKFEFTKNVSDILSEITMLGKSLGFTREDLSYSDISVFKKLHNSAANNHEMIKQTIEVNKQQYEHTQHTSMPQIISSSKDIWSFEHEEGDPNFITQKTVVSRVKNIRAVRNLKENISGKIICIENADPGFDWIFSYKIDGLITMWGGANSHMAIRSGELGLPAVIGAGQLLFEKWAQAHTLFMDCPGRRVEIIS